MDAAIRRSQSSIHHNGRAMSDRRRALTDIRRQHPVFFWGTGALVAVLLLGTLTALARIPVYRSDASTIAARMSQQERATRDRILNSRARRSTLAVALLQREMRLRSLQQKGLHLALSTADSTLYLRNGTATLRQVRVSVGRDSTVRAPDGRTWRLVRALGERHLREKQTDPTYTIPEWVYVGRGEPVPPEAERQVEGALGRYVLVLDDGTEIYTRPKTGPFAQGVKPGAFVVEKEADLRAIFDALKVDTPVYIY